MRGARMRSGSPERDRPALKGLTNEELREMFRDRPQREDGVSDSIRAYLEAPARLLDSEYEAWIDLLCAPRVHGGEDP